MQTAVPAYIQTYQMNNTYILTYLHMYLHTYMHTCMHTYVHTSGDAYTHIHTHTHVFQQVVLLYGTLIVLLIHSRSTNPANSDARRILCKLVENVGRVAPFQSVGMLKRAVHAAGGIG